MFDWLTRLWRKPQAAEDDDGRAYLYRAMQRDADLRDKGWVPFCGPRPNVPMPYGKLIDVIGLTGDMVTVEYDSIPPWWNLANKYWRVSKFDGPGLTIDASASHSHSRAIS